MKEMFMKRIAISVMSGFCLSLLFFYAYAWATVEQPGPWSPPAATICLEIGGGWYCFDVPDSVKD